MNDAATAKCWVCEHLFDPRDTRGYHRMDCEVRQQASYCPACWQELHGGVTVWALANSCQGIWPEHVYESRAEAERMLAQLNDPNLYETVVTARLHHVEGAAKFHREYVHREMVGD